MRRLSVGCFHAEAQVDARRFVFAQISVGDVDHRVFELVLSHCDGFADPVPSTLVRPALLLVTLPITILTLGLFLVVINALMLLLTSALVPGFTVAGFWPAVLGGILLGLFNLLASAAMRGRC